MEKQEKEKQGKPWKRMGIFNSFREADEKRNILTLGMDAEKNRGGNDFQVKVKRCGFGGKQFMVKFRYLP